MFKENIVNKKIEYIIIQNKISIKKIPNYPFFLTKI